MTQKLLALLKVCSVLVNIRDILRHLSKRERELEKRCTFAFLTKNGVHKNLKPISQVIALLNEAVDTHFKSMRGLNFGADFLTAMNPEYVTSLVKEYLLFGPASPPATSASVPPALKKTLLILEPVTKACPGLRDALFLLAKARYLAGDISAALSTLEHVTENLDPTLAEAHLLMAQIQLHQGNHVNAQQSLEVGLSYNFQVGLNVLNHQL